MKSQAFTEGGYYKAYEKLFNFALLKGRFFGLFQLRGIPLTKKIEIISMNHTIEST